MTTITLYHNRQTRAYRMDELYDGWSLEPNEIESADYSSEVVEQAEFVLPDGYELAKDNTGSPAIYRGNENCPLITNDNGLPCIISSVEHTDGRPLERARG